MRVHVIGGGIGGMSTALHVARLARAGYLADEVEVCIYERGARLGGKSQSQIGEFPGEHGFRFFPNFYRAIVDTLGYIELTPEHVAERQLRPELAGRTVLSLIEDAPNSAVALDPLVVIERAQGLRGITKMARQVMRVFRLGLREATKFSRILVRFLTSSDERMLAEYEGETLHSFFVERHGLASPNFRRFIASLRALSAMRADRGSLRTLLFTATQMLFDFDDEYRKLDGVLPGPTDWLMLEPWRQTLEALGVRFRFGAELTQLEFTPSVSGAPPALRSAHLRDTHGGGSFELGPLGPSDFVVLAVPFEVARRVLHATTESLPTALADLLRIEQRPDNLGEGAEPMVGFQLFLRRRSALPRGHVLYCNSTWAMTSVAQAQFWQSTFTRSIAEVFGQPELVDIVSGIISAWETPGGLGRSPAESSEKEILDEALAQFNQGLGRDYRLDPRDVIFSQVDRDIVFGEGRAFCPTPLWVSPRGSYLLRCCPDHGTSNFFVASDWARTETDVGSMESADEAARLAVRAIAERAPILPPPDRMPVVRPLRLWKAVEAVRKADGIAFALGLPHWATIPEDLQRRYLPV